MMQRQLAGMGGVAPKTSTTVQKPPPSKSGWWSTLLEDIKEQRWPGVVPKTSLTQSPNIPRTKPWVRPKDWSWPGTRPVWAKNTWSWPKNQAPYPYNMSPGGALATMERVPVNQGYTNPPMPTASSSSSGYGYGGYGGYGSGYGYGGGGGGGGYEEYKAPSQYPGQMEQGPGMFAGRQQQQQGGYQMEQPVPRWLQKLTTWTY